jgi:hypothetical protein
MSIEISLITGLLAAVFGSTSAADALIEIYKKLFEKKSVEPPKGSGDNIISDTKLMYLTPEKESEIATEAAIEALNLTYDSTLAIRNERMRQAKLSFNAALVLMCLGVLIIFVGIGFLWFKGEINRGAITVAGGAITQIISALVFRFNKETNNRLEVIRKELSSIETARVGLSMAKQINDLEKRDNAIVELTKRVQASG